MFICTHHTTILLLLLLCCCLCWCWLLVFSNLHICFTFGCCVPCCILQNGHLSQYRSSTEEVNNHVFRGFHCDCNLCHFVLLLLFLLLLILLLLLLLTGGLSDFGKALVQFRVTGKSRGEYLQMKKDGG